jgi:hypothetical protein
MWRASALLLEAKRESGNAVVGLTGRLKRWTLQSTLSTRVWHPSSDLGRERQIC